MYHPSRVFPGFRSFHIVTWTLEVPLESLIQNIWGSSLFSSWNIRLPPFPGKGSMIDPSTQSRKHQDTWGTPVPVRPHVHSLQPTARCWAVHLHSSSALLRCLPSHRWPLGTSVDTLTHSPTANINVLLLTAGPSTKPRTRQTNKAALTKSFLCSKPPKPSRNMSTWLSMALEALQDLVPTNLSRLLFPTLLHSLEFQPEFTVLWNLLPLHFASGRVLELPCLVFPIQPIIAVALGKAHNFSVPLGHRGDINTGTLRLSKMPGTQGDRNNHQVLWLLCPEGGFFLSDLFLSKFLSFFKAKHRCHPLFEAFSCPLNSKDSFCPMSCPTVLPATFFMNYPIFQHGYLCPHNVSVTTL